MLPLNVHIYFSLVVFTSPNSVKIFAIILSVPQILALILFAKYSHSMHSMMFRPCNALPIVMLSLKNRLKYRRQRISLGNHLSQWNEFRLNTTGFILRPLYFSLLVSFLSFPFSFFLTHYRFQTNSPSFSSSSFYFSLF